MNDWKERFEMIWHPDDRARYRQGSAGQRYAAQFLEHVSQGATINEYGSGTGRAVIEIRRLRPDVSVNMIDIAENALEHHPALIDPEVTYTVCDLARLPSGFPVAAWGYCVGVLMLVDPDKLDAILSEIRRTCQSLFAEVYNLSDVRCGIELTTIKQDWPWWADRLRAYWPHVEFMHSREHQKRYVFICREAAL